MTTTIKRLAYTVEEFSAGRWTPISSAHTFALAEALLDQFLMTHHDRKAINFRIIDSSGRTA